MNKKVITGSVSNEAMSDLTKEVDRLIPGDVAVVILACDKDGIVIAGNALANRVCGYTGYFFPILDAASKSERTTAPIEEWTRTSEEEVPS